MKLKLLLLLLTLVSIASWAEDVEINGVSYKLNDETMTASVTYCQNIYDDVTIQSSISHDGQSYTVTTINSHAFHDNTHLISVSIPNTVISIENFAFDGCKSMSSLTIPSSVQNIGTGAFKDCFILESKISNSSSIDILQTGLTIIDTEQSDGILIKGDAVVSCRTKATKVTIPETISTIADEAFYKCFDLLYLDVPNSVRTIGRYAFHYCENLASIILPKELTSISDGTFSNCENLHSINIPDGVTSIGRQAFIGCSSLLYLNIPASVTEINDNAFSNISANIIFAGIPKKVNYYAFQYFKGDVLGPVDLWYAIQKSSIQKSHFYSIIGWPNWQDHCESLLKGVRLREPYIETYNHITNLRFYNGDVELPFTLSDDGVYIISGLEIRSYQTITLKYTTANGQEHNDNITVQCLYPQFTIETPLTQTTATINIEASSDETATPSSTGFTYRGKEYNSSDVISGLYPGEQISVDVYAYYDGKMYKYGRKEITTLPLNLVLSDNKNSATSLELIGSHIEGDAKLTQEYIIIDNKEYLGNHVILTGLEPNSSHSAVYSVYCNGKRFTYNRAFITEGLQMTTLQPKVVSEGNVVIAADTNLDDDEPNIGFEWRRTDWTNDFSSNTGAAYAYNGHLEGYIRNLNVNYLWKYRPYFVSASGNYYYGDWVGIDPTNTSYFEATVHTYDKINVEGNSAIVKGYAMRGTDNIKIQGFIYWKKVSGERTQGRMKSPSIPNEAQTIEASGQIMNATLTGLDFSSEYSVVAFATTSEGDTFYGEEITFITADDPTGIDQIALDSSKDAVTVSGYYNLSGRKVENPHNGIYIIHYSDGTSRKKLMK